MVPQYNTTAGLFQLKTSKSPTLGRHRAASWPKRWRRSRSHDPEACIAKFWESEMTQNELLHPMALPHGSKCSQYMVCVCVIKTVNCNVEWSNLFLRFKKNHKLGITGILKCWCSERTIPIILLGLTTLNLTGCRSSHAPYVGNGW